METPFGPCHHTHYEGGPPCVHTAYLMGVEDGRVLPERATAEIACTLCGWDFGYENNVGDLLPAWEWHLTDKRHMQAVEAAIWSLKEMVAAGVEIRAHNLPPTNWHPEAAPGELDDLYSGVKPAVEQARQDTIRERIAAALTREAQEMGLYDVTDEEGCTYVTVSDRPVAVTEEVSHGVMVDRDEDGGIVGVQVLK